VRGDGRRPTRLILTEPAKESGGRRIAGHRFDRSNVPLLATLGLGVFAGALDLGALSPALPALARDFHVGPSEAAWVFTLYLFATVVSIPITAKLSDVYGRRASYVACVGLFGLGSLLAVVAPSFGILLVARALQAVGAGGIFPVATAAIADRVPPEARGSALGLLGALWGLAAIVGPTVGGLLTGSFGWHWIFIPNVPLAAWVIVRALRDVPADAPSVRGPLDAAGITVLSLGLLASMFALTRLDPHGAQVGGLLSAGGFAIAIVAFAALVPIERRAAEPVIPPALFARRQLAIAYGLEVLIGGLEGALFFVPAALVAAQHVSYAVAGAIAAIGAVAFVAVIPFAGRALDVAGSRVVLFAGAVCTALGLAAFAYCLGTSLWSAIAALALAGIGFGALLGAPTRYLVGNEAPAGMRATAIGLLSIFLIVGQILGGSLAGGVTGAAIGDASAYRLTYAAFAALAVVTALATLLLASRARERRAAHN
jgi:EmrB/QacA subfamily drug resistance transporter